MSYKAVQGLPREALYQVAATLAAGILAHRPNASAVTAAEVFWECLYETFPTAPGHQLYTRKDGGAPEHRFSEEGPLSGYGDVP